ncbi:MAG: amidohydrolase [Gammaproteobacteria bacterium]|nr:amidohydrolase [Gammaproteobacteria bacterium]
MFIVDTQVHIWKEETPDRPWLPGARARMKLNGHREEAFSYEECLQLMDEAGVSRVLIVPPSWEGDRVDYALEACEKHPDRFGIMARVPQDKPEEAKAMMRDWKSIPYIKGTRLTFHRPQDRNWMIDGTAAWYWPFAEELGVKTMVHAPIWKAELGAIAKRHPGLRIIIDHMGIMARCVDDAIGYWVEETADLHVHPNIYVKVSAVPAYSTHPYPYGNIAKYVEGLVARMGARRCFWGTDLTRLLEHGLTYKQTSEHFTKHMKFTAEQLEWIMGRGICECLDWPIPNEA